ncbi:MAG: ChaN family lipoprotein [DPANN group archaeon]|nr:ChaN family lipoprotein [DPANN group archaeon]
MDFSPEGIHKIQADIDEFKKLKEQVIRLAEECQRYTIDIIGYKNLPKGQSNSEVPKYMFNNLEQLKINKSNHDMLYNKYEVKELAMLLAFKKYFKLPFPIDNEYGLDIIVSGDKVPIVFSYENINENITCLWDTNHKISEISRGYMCVDIDRVDIFLKGIEAIEPNVLALELTSDDGQRIIDSYMAGNIDSTVVRIKLAQDHASVGPYDDYTRILNFAKENNIIVKAVDMVTADYKEIFNISTFQQGGGLTEYEKHDEISKTKTRFIKSQLDAIATYGDVLLIVGAGHRANFLKLYF